MGVSLFPSCWFFGLSCPSTGVCRLLVEARSFCQNGNFQESSHWRIFTKGLCHQCPCYCIGPQLTSASQGHPAIPAGRSSSGSYGVTLLPCMPVHVKHFMHSPRVESLFAPVMWSSCTQAPLAFKTKCSWGSSSQCQTPRLGGLTWGSELLFLWENLWDIIIFQLVGHPLRRYGIWLFCEITPLPILLWFFLCLWM